MHELSIALSIVDGAAEEALRQGNVKVNAVHLKLGPLSGVVKEALLFSYDLACQGTCLEGSRLVVEELPVMIYCSTCRQDKVLDSIQHFCCPTCGALTSEVTKGTELEIVALEIQEIEAA